MYWGVLLALVLTFATLIAAAPLWWLQGKTGIPGLLFEIVLVGIASGLVGGLLFSLCEPLQRLGLVGYYASWVLPCIGGMLAILLLLLALGRGLELGLQRLLSPMVFAGLGGLLGLVLGRAQGHRSRVDEDELRRIARTIADALEAETVALERRAPRDQAAAAALAAIRRGQPSEQYTALLERVAERLHRDHHGSPLEERVDEQIQRLVASSREDLRRMREDPSYSEELERRHEKARVHFVKELEREAKHLRRLADRDPQAERRLKEIEAELAERGRRIAPSP